MRKNRYIIIEGQQVRPQNLLTPKGKAIYKVALHHPCVSDLICVRSTQGDDVIQMTLLLEVPDKPLYPILEREPVAIKCAKADKMLPEVYAARYDFPLDLPHRNVMPFDRPVSLCVSDVVYDDIRSSFNAFEFIESIRRWFQQNAIGELHEKDRPLEVFFIAPEFSYLTAYFARKEYLPVKYTRRTPFTSVIEEVRKDKSDYSLVSVLTQTNISGAIRRVPECMGDLRGLHGFNGMPLTDYILAELMSKEGLLKSTKPLMVCLMMPMKRDEHSDFENVNLFALRFEKPAHDIVHAVKKLGKYATAYVDQLVLKTSVLLTPAELRELAFRNGTSYEDREITIIGTGSLGSQVLDHFVRCGNASVVNIVDNDVFFPHNMARHTLEAKDIMKFKVDALKEKYEGIHGLKINVYRENYLHADKNTIDRIMKTCQLVVDASTSVSVERKLALDIQCYPVRRCSVFLNPQGTDVVMMMEDKSRLHRLDLLEMDYYRNIIYNEALVGHLDLPEKHPTNVFSCRSESVVMSFDGIGTLASVVSSQIKIHSVVDEAELVMWRLQMESGDVHRVKLDITEWMEIKQGFNTVYISKAVYEEMCEQRTRKLDLEEPVETGGTFIGTYDRDRHIIYVVYMIAAPDDSVATETSYIRGVKGLAEEVERLKKLTGYQMMYIGEWHSHPHGCSEAPSTKDKKLFAEMSDELGKNDYPFVMGILSDEGLRVEVAM
jgi:integrative and conjugative element protein (TIGR02256 family)